MAKIRKRKQPITSKPIPQSLSGSKLIRSFHTALKRRHNILTNGSASTSKELNDLDQEIERLGGLETYQRTSIRGQGKDRGGGSEKIFIEWLKQMGQDTASCRNKLRLLEVGALKHDNYKAYSAWIDCFPIDLHSQHPLIKEQDFLAMNIEENSSKWDAIALSLVLNFAPDPHDRGKMLSLAYNFLRDDGYLFVALPLPCVMNSRYLDFDRLKAIMAFIGFTLLKERWKIGGKMVYWLFGKGIRTAESTLGHTNREIDFSRKCVLREGRNRNNFAILI